MRKYETKNNSSPKPIMPVKLPLKSKSPTKTVKRFDNFLKNSYPNFTPSEKKKEISSPNMSGDFKTYKSNDFSKIKISANVRFQGNDSGYLYSSKFSPNRSALR